jgi:hypothetical protein
MLEDVRASVENVVEAKLVARLSAELRHRVIEPGAERPSRPGVGADRRF